PDTGWRQRVRLLVGTGMLGSFTTYSTLAVDTDLFLRSHQWWAAGSYAAGTVLVGLVATTAGIAIAARLRTRPAEATQ
ncbi:MAG: CrcB family protein, partial [Brevibacterium sp.]|nr:CrcB family protein [Brevibacterium sp.]